MESFEDIQFEADEHWRRVRAVWASGQGGPALVKRKQNKFREIQRARSLAGDLSTKHIRGSHSSHCPESSAFRQTFSDLDPLMSTLQTSRDDYCAAEYEYNILENKLDEEESELAKLENRMYRSAVSPAAETGRRSLLCPVKLALNSTPDSEGYSGYDSLAAFLGYDYETAVSRRFDQMSSRILLYMSSELVELETRLKKIDDEEHDDLDSYNLDSLKMKTIKGGTGTQVNFLPKLQECLKEYST